MKVHRIIVLVVDHDELGQEGVIETIQNTRYPNRCIAPQVMGIETADVGPWSDDHPMNHYDTMRTEFARLFPE